MSATFDKKNVAIFDDFISSNGTNEDFDEITATLGDVDAYIEHQQKLQSERGGKRGGKGGKRGGGGGGGGKGEHEEGGAGGRGGKAGRGGEGGGRGGRGGGEGGGRGGGEGGRGGRGGGEGGRGGRGGGEGGRGGRGGGRGGGNPGEGGEYELRRRGVAALRQEDDIDKLKAAAHAADGEGRGGGRGAGRGGRGGGGRGGGAAGQEGGKGKGGKGKGGKGGKGGRGKEEVSLKGVAIMLIGTLCMSGSMTTTKLASKIAPVVQVRFIRSLLTCIAAYFYANSFKGKSVAFSKIENKKGIGLRVGMTVFQTFAQMYVARKLPLGLTAALLGLSPVTTSILNYFILKTKIPVTQWACIFMSVTGIMLISQPAFLFGDNADFDAEDYDTEKMCAIALAVVMNVMRSLTMILNRKLIQMGEGRSHFSQMTFYTSLASTVLCLGLLPFKGNVGYKIMEMPSLEAWGLMVLGAALFFGRPLLMELGAARLPQSLTVILRSSNILWAFLFQLVLFGDIPNSLEGAGIAVLVGSASLMFKLTGSE